MYIIALQISGGAGPASDQRLIDTAIASRMMTGQDTTASTLNLYMLVDVCMGLALHAFFLSLSLPQSSQRYPDGSYTTHWLHNS